MEKFKAFIKKAANGFLKGAGTCVRALKSKTARAVFRIIFFVIISLTIAFTVYRWNSKNLLGNEMPMPFGFGVSVVLSGSMEPELSVDDLVFVKECDEYNVRDVVVYQSGKILVIHRIISITENEDGTVTVITQGDANKGSPDDPISLSDIKGKMIGKLSGVGGLVTELRKPYVTVSVLSVAVILLILSGRVERKEQKAEEDNMDTVREEIRRLREELGEDGENDRKND